MDREQRLAFVQAQCVCAAIEMEAMKAENQLRESSGHAPAYGEDAFQDLIGKYLIGHNAVIEFLRE